MPPAELLGRFRERCTGRTVKLHVQIVPGRDEMVEFRVMRIVPVPGSETFRELGLAFARDGTIKCACDDDVIRLPNEVRDRLKTADS
jgi:hypothetical protein